MLTRVAAQHLACVGSVALFLDGALRVVGRRAAEADMLEFVGAGGVHVLLCAMDLYPTDIGWFAKLVADVMASDAGRGELLACRGMETILYTLSRAEDEEQVTLALAALTYRPQPPHDDVLRAFTAAGGVAVLTQLLRTHPAHAHLAVVASLLLSDSAV